MKSDRDLIIATLSAIELIFAVRFGTYTKDDTVKITEIFDLLRGIKEHLGEEPNDKD